MSDSTPIGSNMDEVPQEQSGGAERASALPHPLTALVGREHEMHETCLLLLRPHVRLLTLTGTGGIGKTRLGLQIAHEVALHFVDGVFFASLDHVTDAQFVPLMIAKALGMRDAGEQSLFERLKNFLERKQVLLLLDNVEQVLSTAPLLVELLTTCPRLKLLVTSRAALHVRGEYEYSVPPLVLPDLVHLPHADALPHYGSIALFMQRAEAIKPSFQLDDTNAKAIAQLCVHLEGLPLAIELAAAYIKVLSPHALLNRLAHRLSLLTGGAQDLPPRQQTLRNTIKWSYDLLTPDEQCLFRHLALFVGGFSFEAAEAMARHLSLSISILDGITSLVDKSLLRVDEQAGEGESTGRVWMLEILREYGIECLEMAGELHQAREVHTDYFLTLALEGEPQRSGSRQAAWLMRLECEHDNLRAALRFLLAQNERQQALQLCSALYWFWAVHGHLSEGRHWFQQALAGSEQVAPAIRAKALNYAGALAYNEDEHERSEQLCNEALTLYRILGDRHGCATALYWLGQSSCWTRHDYRLATEQAEEARRLFEETGDTSGVADSLLLLAYIQLNQGKYAQARVLLEQGLVLFRANGDMWGIAYTLHYLGRTLFLQGEYIEAQIVLEESISVSQELGYRGGYANALGILGQIAMKQGDFTRAQSLMEESLQVQREAGGNIGIATALMRLGRLTCSKGSYAEARAYYEECLTLLEQLDDKETLVSALEGLGVVLANQKQPEWAIHLWGAAAILRKTIGTPISPAEHEEYIHAMETTRESLGDEAFTVLFSQGQVMTPAQALGASGQAYESVSPRVGGALMDAEHHGQEHQEQRSNEKIALSASPLHSDLTGREIEVVRLVAMGYTNPQIALRLHISPLTVNAHLRSIYNKLEVSSRSAATRYAIEQKLI